MWETTREKAENGRVENKKKRSRVEIQDSERINPESRESLAKNKREKPREKHIHVYRCLREHPSRKLSRLDPLDRVAPPLCVSLSLVVPHVRINGYIHVYIGMYQSTRNDPPTTSNIMPSLFSLLLLELSRLLNKWQPNLATPYYL